MTKLWYNTRKVWKHMPFSSTRKNYTIHFTGKKNIISDREIIYEDDILIMEYK